MKKNAYFIIIKLHYSIALPFGRFEQTTNETLTKLPDVSLQNRFVNHCRLIDFLRAKLQTLTVDFTGVFQRYGKGKNDNLFGLLISCHIVSDFQQSHSSTTAEIYTPFFLRFVSYHLLHKTVTHLYVEVHISPIHSIQRL